MPAPSANVATLLTPAGRGAVATIGLRGPASLAYVQRFFLAHGPQGLEHSSAGIIRVGHWRDAWGEEVVVSPSAGDAWEICCHGGRAAAASILGDLQVAGCVVVDWQEWLAGDGTPLLEQEARCALAATTTARAAGILLDQLDGALAGACAVIEGLLANERAPQEAIGQARDRMARLYGWRRLGEHLVAPWRVVVAGAPNVGKSSLVNAIVGYQRSIVYDRPGTTRDAVSVETAIDGWPIQLVDTAGIRSGTDPIEAAGVERARSHLAQSDLVILVTDASQGASQIESANILTEHPHALRVANKCDLLSEPWAFAGRMHSEPHFCTSTVTGEGIATLIEEIARRLVPAAPFLGEAIPFTVRQADAIRRSLLALENGDVSLAIDAIREVCCGGT